MTVVKVCGLKRVEDAQVAADAGADLLGFVFAPSRRQVDARTVGEIVRQVRDRSDVGTVGVFVNAQPSEMNGIARACGLNYVQLSGDEPEEVVAALDVPAIQVIHVGPEADPMRLAERVAATRADLVLLDTAQRGVYGGTGEQFDWALVPAVGRPVLLAGGLHPGNVGQAIRTARPWGVDVSSGVERAGHKDHAKIRDFITNAKGISDARS